MGENFELFSIFWDIFFFDGSPWLVILLVRAVRFFL